MQVVTENGNIHGAMIDGHTQFDLADIDLCGKVNEILQRKYALHPWMVGANHKAGTIHIELAYFNKVGRLFPFGFMLHIPKMLPLTPKGFEWRIMQAGGELLERFNLERRAASDQSENIAMLNGIDRTDMIL